MFCIARGVLPDKDRKFSLGCVTSLPSKKSLRGVFSSDEMHRWSGPDAVFDSYFNIGWEPKEVLLSLLIEEHQAEQSNYTILIKREGTASF